MIVTERNLRSRIPRQRTTEPGPSALRARSGPRGAGPLAPWAARRARVRALGPLIVMWVSIVVFLIIGSAAVASWWDVA